MKRTARSTNVNYSNIITGNIVALNEGGLARFPNKETMRRDVRRSRNPNDLMVPEANDKLFQIPINFTINALGEIKFILCFAGRRR